MQDQRNVIKDDNDFCNFSKIEGKDFLKMMRMHRNI